MLGSSRPMVCYSVWSLTVIAVIIILEREGLSTPFLVVFMLNPLIGFLLGERLGGRVALVVSLLGLSCWFAVVHSSAVAASRTLEQSTFFQVLFYMGGACCAYLIGSFYERSRLRADELNQKLLANSSQPSKMSTLGEMSAGIIHEINNPLTILFGTIGLTQRELKESRPNLEKVQRNLDRIEQTTLRVDKIVKGMRSLARKADADPMVPERIAKIIEETVELCRPRFLRSSVQLRVLCSVDASVSCRASQISQVLLNLLSNACDAVELLPERWVVLEVAVEQGRIEIHVTDSGLGIPSPIAARILEPFFSTKDPGKGTGLGLSISHAIIQEHQGQLKYDPDCKNTHFVVELSLT